MSRYQSDPDEKHWKIAKVILKYLRNTKDQWLIYGDSDLKFVGYTDFNFQSDNDDSKNMSNDMLKKFQAYTIANSICKMEYITASDAIKKAIWL